jgi:hypothetical protein
MSSSNSSCHHLEHSLLFLLAISRRRDDEFVILYNMLQNSGANLENSLILINIMNTCSLPIVEFFLDQLKVDVHAARGQLLICAVKYERMDIVRLLVARGADVHAQNDRPLIMAVRSASIEAVSYLLKHGADVDAQQGRPLIESVTNGSKDVIKLLLQRGANPDTRHGQPLMMAISVRNTDVVRLLLQHGAQVNINNGRPLIRAIKHGVQLDILDLLIEYNADVNINNGEPLAQAVKWCNFEKVHELIKRGARDGSGEAQKYAWQHHDHIISNIIQMLPTYVFLHTYGIKYSFNWPGTSSDVQQRMNTVL